MKNIRKSLLASTLAALFACASTLHGAAPADTPARPNVHDQLDALFNKRAFPFKGIQLAWQKDGEIYTILEPASTPGKGTDIVAYDTATEILRERRVSDRTYARALAKFGEQGVIDLLGVVGYYNFLAIVMNATRTAMPPGVAEELKRYPE